ncbi:MAG: DUF6465 family protein [Eubacteriales bacterium]|nr:DUF6465 family protein [Eubacteriales bacterium]
MATTKKDQIEAAMAKVEASKVADEKKVVAEKTTEKVAEKAVAEKKAPAKKAATTTKTVAKKAPAKKAATKKSQVMYIQFFGKEISTDEITAKVLEAVGKKTVKELNMYVKPEDDMIYFTADGVEGSVSL